MKECEKKEEKSWGGATEKGRGKRGEQEEEKGGGSTIHAFFYLMFAC